jgi:4-hydroxybenzoate polyprenyltransferase
MNRWWIYQKERFPVLAHGPLIGAFSFCAVAYSASLRAPGSFPSWPSGIVAFLSCFLFFLQLRIADEFKDFEEDSLYRPYRPVPRGLVKRSELGWIFAMGCAVQLGLALWLEPRLLVVLLVTWTYLAAMSKEFLVRDWLKTRPITYLWTHMLIMPLIDLYATSCDWVPRQGHAPAGLLWFLAASFCNGIVIEIGRKVRASEQEERGVETYSKLWGPRKAAMIWWVFVFLTYQFAIRAAMRAGAGLSTALVLGLVMLVAAFVGAHFLRKQTPTRSKAIELMSAVWTFLLYLSLGLLPHLKAFR